MQTPTELITSAQQTKPSTQSTRTYAHSDECFDYVWRGLQAGRFIPMAQVIGGVDYFYWRHQLRDLTDKHLKAGFDQTNSFKGYLTWSEFRTLCMDGFLRIREQQRQAAPPTPAALSDLSSLGQGDRWRELSKVTAAMLAEPKDGPITKAGKSGRITTNYIRGKSATEIIEQCNRSK